ncbi:MAG: endonuclease MutS2 [Cyclobacteriaceae bacterium]
MVYPVDIEQKLGFDQIREKLKAYCLCPLGMACVDTMKFLSSKDEIVQLLKENLEFRHLLERGDGFPAQHFIDPTGLFQSIAIEGSYLEPADFLKIRQSLETIFLCKEYLIKNQTDFPTLFALTHSVTIGKNSMAMINRVIDDAGQVRDSASDELKRIRKLLLEAQARLRKQIDLAYRQAVAEQWVPEGGLPTIRQGRLVIPVLAEYKRKFRGFILDESATGQTVYMEPAEALEASNEIRDLEHAVHREEIRILKELTARLRGNLTELKSAYRFLGHIDFTRARALLSLAIDATMPLVHSSPAVNWICARHPLLLLASAGKRKVVPLTINLRDTERILLVSGPNAGGKSVCLKTVGLLQFMLQCGLLVPASADSSSGIVDSLFIDIGDQQSIENDLSTYSSHLKNLGTFIKHANGSSLVLLDELGSGTDPNFGGAIAEAVLEALLQRKAWVVATTHYYNLKLFAGKHQGIRNASMRFDTKNMVPLFILDIGRPGSSFALEIARKSGIPGEVVDKAEQLIGKELTDFDQIVKNLEEDRNELTRRLNEAETSLNASEQVRQNYETLLTELESRKKELLERAKDEAAELVRQANREIEKTIRHIRENQAHRSETLKARKNLQEIAKKVTQNTEHTPFAVRSTPAVGDRVRMVGHNTVGTVLSIKGKFAMVQFGEVKSKVELTKLEKSNSTPYAQNSSGIPVAKLELHEKQAAFSSLLDVRGKRAEEVIPVLAQFLDTAVLLGYRELKILHGKGEGILRTVVRNELKKHDQVETYSDEHVDRGGAGITVVVLK